MIDQRQPVELGQSRPQFGEAVQAVISCVAKPFPRTNCAGFCATRWGGVFPGIA